MNNRLPAAAVLAPWRCCCRWPRSPCARTNSRCCCSSARSSAHDYGPGLHFKLPLVQTTCVKFDRRILTQDYRAGASSPAKTRTLSVDFFVKWRISDVSQFYRASGGTRKWPRSASATIVKDGIKSVVARRTLQEIVIGGAQRRSPATCSRAPAGNVNDLGIELIDVRIKRIDLPEEVSELGVPAHAAELRAPATAARRGPGRAETIRAEADRQRTEMLANAQRDAQTPRRGRRDGGRHLSRGLRRNRRSSTPSTAACRPIRELARQARRRAGGLARRGVLQVLRRVRRR